MNITDFIKSVLASLQGSDVPGCVVGEIALNYYNAPRVVHDLEICVPEALLAEAESTLCRKLNLERVENEDFDIFTEYKRGHPLLKSPANSLRVVLFPDSYFNLAPLHQNTVPSEERVPASCSQEILDVVAQEDIESLPVPRLPAFFIGLCLRFFESGDCMARIAVEQLVDSMDLDKSWVKGNLAGASPRVRELAEQLVAEKASRINQSLGVDAYLDVLGARMEDHEGLALSGF